MYCTNLIFTLCLPMSSSPQVCLYKLLSLCSCPDPNSCQTPAEVAKAARTLLKKE